MWRGARGQAVEDLPEGQVVTFPFQVGLSAGVLVLAYSLNRREESVVVVSGSSPPVISSSLADLVDFAKSGADRVLKVLGRQGPSLVLGFGGEPIPSALLSAALTFGVEFVEVPFLSVDPAPVTVAHRDENALGPVDELRCSELLLHVGVANRRVGVFQQYLLEFLVAEPGQARCCHHIRIVRAGACGACGLDHSCAPFRSEAVHGSVRDRSKA